MTRSPAWLTLGLWLALTGCRKGPGSGSSARRDAATAPARPALPTQPVPFRPQDGPLRNPLNLYDVLIEGSPDYQTVGQVGDAKVTMQDLEDHSLGAFSRIGDRIYQARETGWRWLVEHTALARSAEAAHLELAAHLRQQFAALPAPSQAELAAVDSPELAGRNADDRRQAQRTLWRWRSWEVARSLLVDAALQGIHYERIRYLITKPEWARPEMVEGKLDGRDVTRGELRLLSGWREELARTEYFEIAKLQFEAYAREHVVDLEAKRLGLTPDALVQRDVAKLGPIRPAEVDAFIKEFPEYGKDAEGRERARDNVRRLREISARDSLIERLFKAKNVTFFLHAPVPPRAPLAVPSPRRGGDPKAAAVVVALHGVGCPECALGSQVLLDVMSRHPSGVRLVAGDYFLPFNLASYRGALALRCADEQHRWWPLLAALIPKDVGSLDDVVALATPLGLEPAAFRACLDADRFLPDVAEDLAFAERLGLEHSIPGVFVNGVRIGQLADAEKVARQVDEALAQPALLDQP